MVCEPHLARGLRSYLGETVRHQNEFLNAYFSETIRQEFYRHTTGADLRGEVDAELRLQDVGDTSCNMSGGVRNVTRCLLAFRRDLAALKETSKGGQSVSAAGVTAESTKANSEHLPSVCHPLARRAVIRLLRMQPTTVRYYLPSCAVSEWNGRQFLPINPCHFLTEKLMR